MTPQEFKAWFDGFTENVDKAPTQKQWARIKERVAEIDGKAVTERVYVDRYLPHPYRHRYWDDFVWAYTEKDEKRVCRATSTFSGSRAMLALGRADAASLS